MKISLVTVKPATTEDVRALAAIHYRVTRVEEVRMQVLGEGSDRTERLLEEE